MAKKIVRGITDIKDINKQDFDTNNVNDLLSDGQYNYIHRKKGKSEEYHNLTDNIKTISSDNTELLSVTNNNKTTNTATLSPKHDAQKEQVLESTRNTISIHHGENGTDEKTTVDTNPKKVLEHENLISSSQYVTIEHVEDSNTSEIKTDELNNTINELNSKITTVEGKIPTDIGTVNLIKGTGSAFVMGGGITNTTWNETKKQSILDFSTPGAKLDIKDEILPQDNKFFDFKPIKGTTYTQSIMIDTDATFNPNAQVTCTWYTNSQHNYQKAYIKKVGEYSYQVWSTYTWNLENTELRAFDLSGLHNILLFRTTGTYLAFYKPKLTTGTLPSDWSPATEDTQEQFNSLNSSLAQKQDKLTAMDGISITGDSIYLTSLNDYSEDLNNLTYTCTAKPIDNAPNLPTGVAGNGVLSVIRVGNVVSQTYHALDNNVYYRITNNSSSTFVWTPWVKLTTLAV